MYPLHVTFCKHKVPSKPLPSGSKAHAPNFRRRRPVYTHPAQTAVRGANVNVFEMFGTRTLFANYCLCLHDPLRNASLNKKANIPCLACTCPAEGAGPTPRHESATPSPSGLRCGLKPSRYSSWFFERGLSHVRSFS